MYDLIIIGGGPAASAAAVYAARKRLNTALVAAEFGGQSVVSTDIQNWIGTPHIAGADLAKSLKGHVFEYQGEFLTIREGAWVTSVTGTAGNFSISINEGKETMTARAVLIATGSSRKKLTVPGADAFENKGLTYCASCDGPLFAGEDVVVVGAGNAAIETAAQLLAYCKSVTLLNRSDVFKADEISVAQTMKDPKFKALLNVELVDVYGGDFVDGVTITHKDGTQEKVPGKAVFVEIGQIPNAHCVKDLVKVNSYGSIEINPRTQETSTPGVWAAGDATDVLYHQNNIAAGDAVRALEDIYLWLHRNK